MSYTKKELNDLHQLAMAHAEEGFFLNRKNNKVEAVAKFVEAFKVEQQVADYLIDSKEDVKDIEPSRSIVCLSCAALANDAGYLSECEKYAKKVVEFDHDSYFVDEANELLK